MILIGADKMKILSYAEAIKLQESLFPLGEYEYSPMISHARKIFREELTRLYDNGYCIVNNGGKDE